MARCIYRNLQNINLVISVIRGGHVPRQAALTTTSFVATGQRIKETQSNVTLVIKSRCRFHWYVMYPQVDEYLHISTILSSFSFLLQVTAFDQELPMVNLHPYGKSAMKSSQMYNRKIGK